MSTDLGFIEGLYSSIRKITKKGKEKKRIRNASTCSHSLQRREPTSRRYSKVKEKKKQTIPPSVSLRKILGKWWHVFPAVTGFNFDFVWNASRSLQAHYQTSPRFHMAVHSSGYVANRLTAPALYEFTRGRALAEFHLNLQLETTTANRLLARERQRSCTGSIMNRIALHDRPASRP